MNKGVNEGIENLAMQLLNNQNSYNPYNMPILNFPKIDNYFNIQQNNLLNNFNAIQYIQKNLIQNIDTINNPNFGFMCNQNGLTNNTQNIIPQFTNLPNLNIFPNFQNLGIEQNSINENSNHLNKFLIKSQENLSNPPINDVNFVYIF